jgi:bacillolysin
MKKIARLDRTLIAALIVVGGLFSASPALAASNEAAALKRALGPNVRVAEHRETGLVRFVGTAAGKPISRPAGLTRSSSSSQAARGFLERHGKAFGISDQSRELRVAATEAGTSGRSAVRFQQLAEGVPVLGGELVVNLDADKNVLSANGEALPAGGVTTSPQVVSEAARQNAVAAVAKTHGVAPSSLKATIPELWIYDSRILGGPGLERPVLVWRLEVRGEDAVPINELILIDAARGSVALRIDQIAHAKNRTVCDANNTDGDPGGTYPCVTTVRSEGQGPVGSPADVNVAYDFAGDTYDYFFTRFGRDSLDGAGLPLKSTVRYCDPADPCPMQNAFWDGSQMAYGQGFAAADDVVGHELTHGVTDFSAHLFYYFQSGAINESMSDVFGEFVDIDQHITAGDTAATRWKLGEDLSIGAIRDMEDPALFGQPDRMTSPNYAADAVDEVNGDSGGVHTNSGVNNKAAFLMTDGATFNTRTVTGLGITKVARIYYTVLTTMLTSASDYADLANALPQACANLVGTAGITAADCGEVSDAVAAVEMSVSPPASPTTPDAPVCPSGFAATTLFADDIESPNSGRWTLQPSWYYPQNPNPFSDATYATSGTKNIWGDDRDSVGDYSIAMSQNVAIPAGSPAAFLRFNHAFGFEDAGSDAWDGGLLEYSLNNGPFNDIGSLLTEGGYNGTISTASNNPLEGRNAFVRESNGYGSSRATITSLAGQNVRFRFRIGTDVNGFDDGWFIDDVQVYYCGTLPPPPPPPPPPAPPVVVTPVLDTLSKATVKSCRRTGRARKTRVICSLRRFGAVRRVTVKVTRRGRTVASGSAKPSRTGTVTIKGKRTLQRGSYRVTLTLRDASGKTRKLTKTLKVR